MRRAVLTVNRNDIRTKDFRRYTVWLGARPLFDVEATLLVDTAIVTVRNRKANGDPGRVLICKRVGR